MKKRHFFYSLPVLLLLIVAVAGWFATDKLGNKARQEIMSESQAAVETLSIYVASTFTNIEGAVKSLAGSPWIAPLLLSKRDQDIAHANSALDRYNAAIKASVSYLMNADGLTVASSNRKDPDSFVGKSYRFRPYFQEAAKGKPDRYFALGITSGNRGFYASYPVRDDRGKVLGVVTMKKDLDEMEDFFSRYPFCFLISPDGIIFLSSKSAMVLKSIWPLDKKVQEKLLASQQFGNKVSAAVFKKEIADGEEVTLGGDNYFVSRKMIVSDGWSIMLLTPTDRINAYKLIGILVTVFLGFLIIIFSGIIYVTDRSRVAIRQSENKYRMLADNINDVIFVLDMNLKYTYISPSVKILRGYEPEEVLQQSSIETMTPSSKELVIRTLSEVMALEKSGERDISISRMLQLEVKRKDGTTVWTEMRFSFIRDEDQRPVGIMGVTRDITERRLSEEKLRESETRQSILLANLPAGVMIIDPVTRVIESVNHTAAVMFGAEAEHIVGHRCHKFLCPAIEGACPVCDLGKEVDNAEREMVCADGSRLPVLKSVKRVQIGGQEKLLECFVEISAQKRAEEALKCSETKFRTLYDSNSDAVMLLNKKGFFDCNKAALKMFGCATMEEFCAKHPADLSLTEQPDGTDSTVLANQMIAAAIERGSIQFEWMHKRNDNGETFPAEVLLTAMELNGKPAVQAVVRDITARKQTEEKIRQMAYHDSLTALPNRKLFSDRLSIALAQSQRNQQKVGIAMLDLDKFKDVNDTMGHDVGDLLLLATAERLSAALRKGDTVARFGGDEFVLIFPDLHVIEDVTKVAQKIVDSFSKPFLIGTRQLAVTTSIGIAVYPDDGTDEGTILKNADIAMYQAKQAGRARYQIYKGA